jgi:hypothetical protein
MGLSRNLRRLEALVEQAPVDDLGFLDKASLLDCLQRTALGNAGDAGATVQFEGTLSLLLWLTQQRGGFGRRECAEAPPPRYAAPPEPQGGAIMTHATASATFGSVPVS